MTQILLILLVLLILDPDRRRSLCPHGKYTPQTPIGANNIWPMRDQSDENLGRVFVVWGVWG